MIKSCENDDDFVEADNIRPYGFVLRRNFYLVLNKR